MMINNLTYDKELAANRQMEFASSNGFPHFAPLNGVCFKCRKNIYEPIEIKSSNGHETFIRGISVESASSSLITGCPHCFASYCD